MNVTTRLDAIENQLDNLTVDQLIERARQRHEERIARDNELLQAQKRARIEAIEQEVNLLENQYIQSCINALRILSEREEELQYWLNEDEKAIVAGDIAWDSDKVRATSWQKFDEKNARMIRHYRKTMWSKRSALKKILQ